MTKKVLILVPYKVRDFDGYSLIAWHLKRKYNIDSYLTNAYGVKDKIAKYKPELFVTDHLTWEFKVQELAFCQKNNIVTCLYPTEGMVMRPDDFMTTLGQHHNSESTIDILLAWGDYHIKMLEDKSFFENDSKYHIVGSARFDFYNKSIINSGFFWSKQEFAKELNLQNPNGPVILWATSTPYAVRDKDEIIKRYTNRSNYTVEYIEWLYEDNILQLKNNLSVFTYLAKQHPEWNFIVKVHPAEWLNPYIEIAEKTPNITIASDRVITDYLAHTDVLLQRNCTTSTEAWIMGLPVIQMELENRLDPFYESHRILNEITYTPEEADIVLTKYIENGNIPTSINNERTKFISELYYLIDGKSAERIADHIHSAIEKRFDTTEKIELKDKKLSIYEEKQKSIKQQTLAYKVKNLIGIRQEKSLRLWKFKAKKERIAITGVGEMEITQVMVDNQFELYDSCLTEIFLQ